MSLRSRFRLALVLACLGAALTGPAAAEEDPGHPLGTLPIRDLGPAITSGRISDFAFHPERPNVFYAAVASGGLWKTEDDGIRWTPIFDDEGSYALACVELAPSRPLTVWVGTGENNAQRSVGFGDGVYKSVNGGQSWERMGLEDSGHIGRIWIHPEDPDHVLVAAQGPLWSDGGDRGLYRTLDGGRSWKRVLEIDRHTGVNEFVVDPRNPEIIVASSWQRRRHVWVLLDGGPGSGLHKTTDGGETWTELTAGLPSKDPMGRIGLAAAPSEPDTIYAIVEGADDERGIYRSTDFGETWEKRSDRMTTSPQYYNELVVDPQNPLRVYSLDTFTHVSEDGGTSWSKLSSEHRHVDDHALWIDPRHTEHLYIGGDGGIYESWDRGTTWRHVRNLPITQFYRIHPDDAEPFYNVCGGTQDNNSLCAPSRTPVIHGITNADWTIILGGDGYKPQMDPQDPDIIYTQYQYGGLARYDRRTQERIYITPQPDSGENRYKWNWNSPLLLSPHSRTRLYYAAERVFRSDDRGNSWKAISGDLTRGLDRNELEVMGRVWSVDAVAKNDSTSMYGSIIALSESPLEEGLLYVGTDDGLIQVTGDGGDSWTTRERFGGVPSMSLCEDIVASRHDAGVAYAVFDNHKRGDHKPYVLKTTDRGRTWRGITGNLPERGSAHTIAEDHVDPNLLFVGTEFGLYFTQNGGKSWHELTDLPTISVRDLEIQRREHDLVVGTFGRGIRILDDYRPLRTKAEELESKPASLFPVKDAWLYVEGDRWDDRKKGSMGEAHFAAENPPFGAVFTYYLKDGLTKKKEARRKKERELEAENEDTPYPEWEALRAEDRESDPAVVFEIRDRQRNVVRRIAGPAEQGLHRVAWDLRYPPTDPVNLNPPKDLPYWVTPPMGPLVTPGIYTVTLLTRVDGEQTRGPEQTFRVTPLERSPEETGDRGELLAFQRETAELKRTVSGASKALAEIENRLTHLSAAIDLTPDVRDAQRKRLERLRLRALDLKVALEGDRTVSSRNEPTPWSISERVDSIVFGHWESQSAPIRVHKKAYRIAAKELRKALEELEALARDVATLETGLEDAGAPWTPSRIPRLR